MDGNEAAIDRALDEVSAADFQRLTEAYAELTWPDRYPHLVPQGRNAFNATTTGWPDAWAAAPDGRIHAVESTLGAWSTHLDEDIAKAKKAGRLGSFVFVSRRRQPSPNQLAPRQEKLRALGLPDGAINLVFRQRLLRELARPRFARVRADILRLPASPSPFVAIELARELYGDGTDAGFVPTREEYESRRVFVNKAAPSVRASLSERSFACIQGHGAAGKTVLCTVIALE